MFIDTARINVRGGKGGSGCRSFYRDKYTRYDTPDGGDGGKGADIVIIADRNLYSLLDFQYNRHFYGANGGHGSGKKKKGKSMPALIIKVPCGTIIKDAKLDCVLRSLDNDGDQVVAAEGTLGGKGNQKMHEVTEPQIPEEKELILDLKVIADVGVIGFPNAGKSTLISSISNARPKIAPYPFTTKFPVLGVAGEKGSEFVIADIPGLIEGSSDGKGLGDKFLRHVERVKILVHMVDISGFEGRDPLEDYKIINQELKKYSKAVYSKTQILAANKMDLETAGRNLERFKAVVKKKIYPISALKKQGLEELIEAIGKKL